MTFQCAESTRPVAPIDIDFRALLVVPSTCGPAGRSSEGLACAVGQPRETPKDLMNPPPRVHRFAIATPVHRSTLWRTVVVKSIGVQKESPRASPTACDDARTTGRTPASPRAQVVPRSVY
jgi:hypothetical protein